MLGWGRVFSNLLLAVIPPPIFLLTINMLRYPNTYFTHTYTHTEFLKMKFVFLGLKRIGVEEACSPACLLTTETPKASPQNPRAQILIERMPLKMHYKNEVLWFTIKENSTVKKKSILCPIFARKCNAYTWQLRSNLVCMCLGVFSIFYPCFYNSSLAN